MRMLLLAAAAAFALAGCTTIPVTDAGPADNAIDEAVQTNLPQVCSAAASAHTLFVIAATFGRFSERTIATERAAWEALQPLCADPSAQTSGRVLDAALRAYQAIQAARQT